MLARLRASLLPLIAALLIGALLFGAPKSLRALEAVVYDALSRLTAQPSQPFPALVIVDIDEASLRSEGQWPWSRDRVAEMVRRISAGGPASISLDIIFPEPDRLSPDRFVGTHIEAEAVDPAVLAGLKSYDTDLAEAIAAAPVVLGHTNLLDAPPGMVLPELIKRRPTINVAAKEGAALVGRLPRGLYQMQALLPNLPELDRAASGIGVVSLPFDTDGVSRAVPLLFRLDDRLLPSFGLETLRVALSARGQVVRVGEAGVEQIVVQGRGGSMAIQTDKMGRIWVRFPTLPEGRDRHFDVVSAADLLSDGFNPRVFRNRIVLVGASAAGLFDIKTTPLGEDSRIPGVDLQGLAIQQALTGEMLRPVDTLPLQMLAGALFLAFIVLAYPFIDSRINMAIVALVLVGAVGLEVWLFANEATYASTLNFFLFALGVGLFTISADFIRRDRQRREIKSAFSQYLSPALVNRISRTPGLLKLGGEMKDLTILFADLRGFTTVSEELKDDPERLTAIINDILTPLTEIIQSHGGTIDKYIGDCIMAFWNAPLDVPDHASAAVRAAVEMVEAMPSINADLEARYQKSGFKIGAGVNSGEVVVGNLGSRSRFDYSVLGDAVNLAARLESLSKGYGVDVIVGHQTQAGRLSETAELVFIDELQVKGKEEPVKIYSPMSDLTTDALTLHSAALTAYQTAPFSVAEKALKAAQDQADSRLTALYTLLLDRRQSMHEAGADAEWTGVWRALEK